MGGQIHRKEIQLNGLKKTKGELYNMKTYTIPQKELEVRYSADVVICGGGTAGVSAARAAADQGCSVIVIEQFGSTGGTSTNGLVTPYMHSGIAGDPGCSYTRKLIAAKNARHGRQGRRRPRVRPNGTA